MPRAFRGRSTTLLFPSLLALLLLFPSGTAEEAGTLKGTVCSETNFYGVPEKGEPIEGARVEAVDGSSFALTNSSGSYALALPAGTYTITWSAPGFMARSVRGIKVTAGNITTKDVLLSRPRGNLTGKVTDSATGEPLSGVLAKVPELRLQDMTGADGSYEIAGIEAGEVNVSYSAAGYETRNLTLRIDADRTSEQDVDLKPTTGALRGRVTNIDTGEEVPWPHIELDGDLVDVGESNGSYRIDKIRPGTYNLTARWDIYEPFSTAVTIVAGCVTRLDIQLRIPWTPVSFQVCTKGDEPIEGATVQFGKLKNVTDENGEVTFMVNETLTWPVKVTHPAYKTYEDTVEIRKGETSHGYSCTLESNDPGGSTDLTSLLVVPAVVIPIVIGAGAYILWRGKMARRGPPGSV